MLLIGQLATAGFLVSHGQVVVAVGAFQRAASGHLDRSIHRDPVFEEPLVKLQAELGIVLVFHRLPLACSSGMNQSGHLQIVEKLIDVARGLLCGHLIIGADGVHDLTDGGLFVQ